MIEKLNGELERKKKLLDEKERENIKIQKEMET